MRSARLARFGALSVAALALSGCATLPWATRTPEPVAVSAPATVPAPPPVKVESEPPVSPTAQRAFDEALRAMLAGRHDEAERAFVALTKSAPELGGPHANLGLLYARTGKLPQAVMALEQAVRSSPRQPQYFNALGIVYRQSGRFPKAREAYEKAIELDPAYAAPLLNLAILNDLYLRDGARALELYDRYLALASNGDAVVTKWVADLKHRNGKQQQVGLLGPKEKP